MNQRLIRFIQSKLEMTDYGDTPVYHGCTKDSVAARLQHGFRPYWHSTLTGDWFCTTDHYATMEMYGRGKGGFRFTFPHLRLCIVDGAFLGGLLLACHIRYDELLNLPAAAQWLEQWLAHGGGYDKKRQCPLLDGRPTEDVADYLHRFLPKETEAFTMPSWHSHSPRSESEIVIVEEVVPRLDHVLTGIYLDGDMVEGDDMRATADRLLSEPYEEDRDLWTLSKPAIQLSLPIAA